MIILGTNRIEASSTVLNIGGVSLFELDTAEVGLRSFDLRRPPSRERIRVDRNKVMEGAARLDLAENEVRLTFGDVVIFCGRKDTKNDTVVDLDLRPVGLAIYTDGAALHVGRSLISGNTFRVTGAAIRVPL